MMKLNLVPSVLTELISDRLTTVSCEAVLSSATQARLFLHYSDLNVPTVGSLQQV